MEVDEYLKDTYDEFTVKAACMAVAKRHPHGILTVPYKERELSRSVMSQVADRMLAIQDVEAVFVIANNTEGETSISARSNGTVNVQIIMEAMNGGGHMTAAAMQKKRCSIDELEQELLKQVDTYFKEVNHESDSEE